MSRLYEELAEHYHAMYQHIFDYDAECAALDALLRPLGARRVLEVGCGSGALARRLVARGYAYLGVDLSEPMLQIARREVDAAFQRADVRTMQVDGAFDAALVTGRTLSHLTTTLDVISALRSLEASLTPGGLLWLDVFDAAGIFATLRPGVPTTSTQEVRHGDTIWRRDSQLEVNLATGWTWDWRSRLTVTTPSGAASYDDMTTLRAFTADELRLLLDLTGFSDAEVRSSPRVLTATARKPTG